MHSTLLTSVKLKVFAFQAESSPLMRDLATETLSHAKCGGGDMACSYMSLKMSILLANKTFLQGSRDQPKARIGKGQIITNRCHFVF